MSDIFLSHTAADNGKAAKLATAFEAQGWTVWLDLVHSAAESFLVRNEELDLAKVFVVLWSRKARESAVVLGVLNFASQRKHLIVVVLLEKVESPVEYPSAEVLDCSDWHGETEGSTWNRVVQELLILLPSFLGKPRRTARPPASLEELSLTEIKENARRGINESAGVRFSGVFISYRRNEAAAYAGRLYDRLAARFGREKVFLDTENVGWGEDFVDVITEAAESCAVIIALISPRWSRGAGGQEGDDYVRLEVATALGRKIRVVPILIQGASMPAPKELPEDLAPLVRRNALALSDTRWERDVEDLMKTLESLLKD